MTETTSEQTDEQRMIKIWDLFIRVFHWTVVVAFFVTWFTGEGLLTLHVWAGYTIGGLLILRLVWGFVGPRHARFIDFLYRPSTVTGYVRDLLAFRARRYLGHSPAGGAMAVALMLALGLTVWSGLAVYAAKENAGPLAATSIIPHASAAGMLPVVLVASEEQEGHSDRNRSGGGVWGESHEFLASATMGLVLLHIAGVLLGSIVHRENLARSMVTGQKRAE